MEKETNLDNRPDWLVNNETGSDEIEFNGKKTPYTIVKKELAPKLPGFLGYPNGEHLFISEEVPKKFRYPQLVHEIIEFTELKGQKNRCLEALKCELSIVPEDIREEYIEYRRSFFARLVEYYKESKNTEFRAEIQASFEFLQSMK